MSLFTGRRDSSGYSKKYEKGEMCENTGRGYGV